jgi:hypothetical protein
MTWPSSLAFLTTLKEATQRNLLWKNIESRLVCVNESVALGVDQHTIICRRSATFSVRDHVVSFIANTNWLSADGTPSLLTVPSNYSVQFTEKALCVLSKQPWVGIKGRQMLYPKRPLTIDIGQDT